MRPGELGRLPELVGSRGCVVRRGCMVYSWGEIDRASDIASAVKPLISLLMLKAVEEGLLKSPDWPVAHHEKRLAGLNGGKDGGITWRHLAQQVSGYGLTEAPGASYAYNDFALALYFDTLMNKVFRRDPDLVLRERLCGPLGFQDPCTFNALGRGDRRGRLAISPRDLARWGLMVLRSGRWGDRSLIGADQIALAVGSPLPAATPLASGTEAEMIPGQRTIGGGKMITPVGPGFYSFNWWTNGRDLKGRLLLPEAPASSLLASGHGGKRGLLIVPPLDLIASWNDTRIEDHDASSGNTGTLLNRLVGALIAAARPLA